MILAFQRAQANLLQRVADAVARVWAGLSGYDEANVAEFVTAVTGIVPVGQQAMGTLVDAYMARMAATAPVGVPVEVVTGLRDVPLEEQYRRPFLRLWHDMAPGADYQQLVAASGERAVTMAATDQQMAMVAATDHVLSAQPRIVGYRRVLTGKSCMFCAAASTRRYTRRDLMPLHSRCDCGIAPIIGHRDPGVVANEDLLSKLKDAGPDYWKQRGFVAPDGTPIDPTDIPSDVAAIDHHTEIGPALQAA